MSGGGGYGLTGAPKYFGVFLMSFAHVCLNFIYCVNASALSVKICCLHRKSIYSQLNSIFNAYAQRYYPSTSAI